MKYQVGDIIRIKSLREIKKTLTCDYVRHNGFITPFNETMMSKLCGKSFKVLKIENNCYIIQDPDNKIQTWYFPEAWIDPLSEKIEKILKI